MEVRPPLLHAAVRRHSVDRRDPPLQLPLWQRLRQGQDRVDQEQLFRRGKLRWAWLLCQLAQCVQTGVEKTLELLDTSSNARGWQAPERRNASIRNENGTSVQAKKSAIYEESPTDQLLCDIELVKHRLEAGLKALIDSEPEVTHYDVIVGDGDCGTTLNRGAEGKFCKLKVT